MRSLNILIIADTDSRLKWASAIASGLGKNNKATINLVKTKSKPSKRIIAGLGLAHVEINELKDRDLINQEGFWDYDLIILGITGSRINRFLRLFRTETLRRGTLKRPLTITGYEGVVYEKHLEGILWRQGADIIAVNSPQDREIFSQCMQALNINNQDSLTVSGYAFAQTREFRKIIREIPLPVRTIAFFPQPTVPSRENERLYIIQRLIDYANAHPQRKVILKLRNQPSERLGQKEKHHYQTLFERHQIERPANLVFDYRPTIEVLPEIDLTLTISSTAAMESLVAGIHAVIINDLGLKESLGNHYFLNSGLLASFDEVITDQIPIVSPVWQEQNGLTPLHSIESVKNKLEILLSRQAKAKTALPFKQIYYNKSNLPYLEFSLNDLKQSKDSSKDSSHSWVQFLSRLRP